MPTIHVFVDDRTYGTLLEASKEMNRTVSNLAESAVSEAALDYAKSKKRQSEQAQPSRREDWHYDSQGYCDNPGRGY